MTIFLILMCIVAVGSACWILGFSSGYRKAASHMLEKTIIEGEVWEYPTSEPGRMHKFHD